MGEQPRIRVRRGLTAPRAPECGLWAGIVERNWGTATLLRQGNRTAIVILAALLWGAFGLFSPDASATSDSISLPRGGTISDLKQHALYRPDPEGTFSAEELLGTTEGFQAYDPAWEENAPPMWIKLNLRAPPNSDSAYRLLVKSRFFLRFDVYLPSGNNGYTRINSGIRNYEPTKKSGHNYVYKFNIGPNEQRDILLFADIFQGSLEALEFSIEDELSFQEHRSTSYWAYGLYFGAMLALIFYNFVLYLNLRTPGHRLYVTAMVCVITLMGLNSGLLLPNFPELIQARGPLLLVVFNALVAGTTARFFQSFVGSHRYIPKLHVLIRYFVWANLGLAAISLVLPVSQAANAISIVQPVGTLTLFLLLGSSIFAGIRGSSSAWIFVAAWTAFFSGSFIMSLLSFGYMERVPAAEYWLYIGSVIEAMILALGLSYRVGQLRTQRNIAIREQQRAARLANIDPLTGAYNRRFIESYLDGLLNSEDKRAFQGSLIMLDMDSFKPINDQYGHAAGDTVLSEMANRCMAKLRSEDVLARLGGDEFAVVLPDQSGDDARAAAERIRKSIAEKPVAYGMQPIWMSASIGVVTNFRPGATAYSAFQHADQALYQAKRTGRDRVVVFMGGEEHAPPRSAQLTL